VAPVVAQFGWSMVRAMLVFLLAVAVGCGLLIGVVYLPAVAWRARLRPRRFLSAALPSLAMGFSTTSSLAALPTMLEAAEHDLAMSRGVAGFVLPLGASVNRAGSALYQAAASTSSTSALTATDLLPSAATWSTTLVPPSSVTAAARSVLNESQVSTSATSWVMTSLGMFCSLVRW
jgi:Na+/H+-dicarboxylate symporter